MIKKKELMEIALRYAEKSYDCEQLRYGDDLYDATGDEIEECVDYWCQAREIGFEEFRKKIKGVK